MGQETFTLVADVDLTAAQYHIGMFTGGKGANISSLATYSAMAGVIQSKTKSGGHVTLARGGDGLVVAGAAVSSVGVYLTTNGSGRAIAATSGQMVCARLLEAATADGDIVQAQYLTPFRWSGAV